MPIKIGSFEPLSEEEFHALRQQKTSKTDPAMVALLAEVESGRPVRVPLVDGQSARGLRTAISRAATSRGLTVETVEGDGFVAVRKVDGPRARKGKQAPPPEGQRRRGRVREYIVHVAAPRRRSWLRSPTWMLAISASPTGFGGELRGPWLSVVAGPAQWDGVLRSARVVQRPGSISSLGLSW